MRVANGSSDLLAPTIKSIHPSGRLAFAFRPSWSGSCTELLITFSSSSSFLSSQYAHVCRPARRHVSSHICRHVRTHKHACTHAGTLTHFRRLCSPGALALYGTNWRSFRSKKKIIGTCESVIRRDGFERITNLRWNVVSLFLQWFDVRELRQISVSNWL